MTTTISPLRQRMIEDMNGRKLTRATQQGHIRACQRFAAFLGRSPGDATPEDIRRFQIHLADSGLSISSRDRAMTGPRFLFRITMRRLDLEAEIYHLREPQRLPNVMSRDEVRRLLVMARNLKTRALLSLAHGRGMRASEVVSLRAGDIDGAQGIIRIVQGKGRKDRNVMQSDKLLALPRQWWRERPTHHDAGVAPQARWLFPGRIAGRHATTRQSAGCSRRRWPPPASPST